MPWLWKITGYGLNTEEQRLAIVKADYANNTYFDELEDNEDNDDWDDVIADNFWEYPQTYKEFFNNIYDVDRMEYISKSGDRIIFITYTDY